jgi:hypothetical protein
MCHFIRKLSAMAPFQPIGYYFEYPVIASTFGSHVFLAGHDLLTTVVRRSNSSDRPSKHRRETAIEFRNKKSREHRDLILAEKLRRVQKQVSIANILPRKNRIEPQFRRFSTNPSYR